MVLDTVEWLVGAASQPGTVGIVGAPEGIEGLVAAFLFVEHHSRLEPWIRLYRGMELAGLNALQQVERFIQPALPAADACHDKMQQAVVRLQCQSCLRPALRLLQPVPTLLDQSHAGQRLDIAGLKRQCFLVLGHRIIVLADRLKLLGQIKAQAGVSGRACDQAAILLLHGRVLPEIEQNLGQAIAQFGIVRVNPHENVEMDPGGRVQAALHQQFDEAGPRLVVIRLNRQGTRKMRLGGLEVAGLFEPVCVIVVEDRVVRPQCERGANVGNALCAIAGKAHGHAQKVTGIGLFRVNRQGLAEELTGARVFPLQQ